MGVSLLFADTAQKIFDSLWYVWLLNVFAMYIVALPAFYFMVRKMKDTVRAKRKMNISEFIMLFFVAQAFMTVGNLVGNYLNMIIGAFLGRDITNSTSELIESSPVWLILIVAVIIGPIVEELIFRKLLMDKLGMYGDRIAIIVSAVAFGIFHGNLYQLFYATMLGALLAYIYHKTSNIWYPIVMHMLINFFGSILPLTIIDKIDRYTELSELVLKGESLSAELTAEFTRLSTIVGAYSLLQLSMVTAGIVILYKKRREIFVTDRCEVLIPKERRVNVILANVGVILFIILAIVQMVLNIFIA